MAPEPRRKARENQFPFELGVRGRKTGITVPDSGIRDEYGMEPMDHLFSSPEKGSASRSTRRLNGNATLSSDEMDEGESTIPEPTTVLASRKSGSMILPPPKGKSPIKTHLKSPARRNPSLGPVSSPVRGSIIEPRAASVSTSVRRRLDFSTGGYDESPTMHSPQKKRGGSANPRLGIAKLGSAAPIPSLKRPFESLTNKEEEDDIPDQVQSEEAAVEEANDDLYQNSDRADDGEIIPELEEEEEEEEEEAIVQPELQSAKNGRGRPARPRRPTDVEEPPPEATSKARGRHSKKAGAHVQEPQEPVERPRKRIRRSNISDVPEPTNSETQSKARSKTQKKTAAPLKPKSLGKRSNLTTIDEGGSPQLQRGPPMPRRTGLLMVRRETPMEGTAFTKTRSGRNSTRPLAYWKNERAEYSGDEVEDRAGTFLMPRIKGVVRVDEFFDNTKRAKRSKSSKAKRRPVESEDEVPAEPWEAEPWEAEPGRLYGDVVSWDPEDPSGAQAEEHEDEIALSSAAIITREIADASFKFAKTLTLPFFGSGVVDLPPGTIKRTKNSRKMQMAFFVFTGRVKAIVNGNEFRISKGGMFQVPRGNTYSIENDYETEARIFFSQGCEVLIEDADESQS